jgi:hypothetical protein
MATTLTLNGKQVPVDVDGETPLLWVLRDTLGLTGTKYECGRSLCGRVYGTRQLRSNSGKRVRRLPFRADDLATKG